MAEYYITEKHFEIFGRIAVLYADIEVGFRFFLGEMLNTPALLALTVSAPYGAYNLNSVVKSVARLTQPIISADKLIALVDKWESFTAIRTAVAHHRWVKGQRENAIQPAFVDVRSGHLKLKGFSPSETDDYTLAELANLAEGLHSLATEVRKLFKEWEADKAINRSAEAISSETESELGA